MDDQAVAGADTATGRGKRRRSLTAPGRALILVLVAASLAGPGPAANQPPGPFAFPFHDGEVLRYRLKWGFVRLATIELTQKAVGVSPDAYEVLLKVKGIRLRSVLDPASPASRAFVQEQTGGRARRLTCRYEADSRAIVMEEREFERVIARHSVPFEGLYVDLVGLIMAIRGFRSPAGRISLPTVVGCALGSTNLTLAAEARPVRIGVFPQIVRARYLRGETDWKALAGVSGPIEAWISEDAAAVPLRIRLNSSLGRVTLELEAVERSDWPPVPAPSPGGATSSAEVSET